MTAIISASIAFDVSNYGHAGGNRPSGGHTQ
jgi:hypothetical protein